MNEYFETAVLCKRWGQLSGISLALFLEGDGVVCRKEPAVHSYKRS